VQEGLGGGAFVGHVDSTGSVRAHDTGVFSVWKIYGLIIPCLFCVCVRWGYNTAEERAKAAQEPSIRLLPAQDDFYAFVKGRLDEQN
jgi:hypothetical protein